MTRSVSQIKPGESDVREQLARLNQVSDTAAIAEGFARHGRIIDELVGDQRTEQFVLAQAVDQAFAIGKLGDLPAAMGQHDGLVGFIYIGILDQAREGREPRSGREQEQPLTGNQIAGDQRARRLAPDKDDIALP